MSENIDLRKYMSPEDYGNDGKTDKYIFHITDILSEGIKEEAGQFVRERCEKLSFKTVVKEIYAFNHTLVPFLNSRCAGFKSIGQISWKDLEIYYSVYLYRKGYQLYHNRKREPGRRDGKKPSDKLEYFRKFYRYVLVQEEKEVPEYKKDVWDIRKLDIPPKTGQSRGYYTLDFGGISQIPVRNAVKRILFIHCKEKSIQTVRGELLAVKRLSCFLKERYEEIRELSMLDREIIEEYIIYLKTESGIDKSSCAKEISLLQNLFFEIGLDTDCQTLCHLFLKGDHSGVKKVMPRPYSDDEIRRFNEALKTIDPQLARFMLTHQMLGTRFSDTVTLKRDSLYEKNGHYYVKIYQNKTSRFYVRPVGRQVAELMKRSMEETQELHPGSEYIFQQKSGALYNISFVKYHMSKMIYENDVRGDDGELFEYKTHRFRHTLGVKLAERGMSDEDIAKMLGHKDTRAVRYYRKIRNMALARDTEEVRKEWDRVLDVYRKEREANGEVREDGGTCQRKKPEKNRHCDP